MPLQSTTRREEVHSEVVANTVMKQTSALKSKKAPNSGTTMGVRNTQVIVSPSKSSAGASSNQKRPLWNDSSDLSDHIVPVLDLLVDYAPRQPSESYVLTYGKGQKLTIPAPRRYLKDRRPNPATYIGRDPQGHVEGNQETIKDNTGERDPQPSNKNLQMKRPRQPYEYDIEELLRERGLLDPDDKGRTKKTLTAIQAEQSISEAIKLREEYLSRIYRSVKGAKDNPYLTLSDYVDQFLLLREISAKIVELTTDWRTQHYQNKPVPMVYEGKNYLLKMCNDLEFLDSIPQETQYILAPLGISFTRNPFILPVNLDMLLKFLLEKDPEQSTPNGSRTDVSELASVQLCGFFPRQGTQEYMRYQKLMFTLLMEESLHGQYRPSSSWQSLLSLLSLPRIALPPVLSITNAPPLFPKSKTSLLLQPETSVLSEWVAPPSLDEEQRRRAMLQYVSEELEAKPLERFLDILEKDAHRTSLLLQVENGAVKQKRRKLDERLCETLSASQYVAEYLASIEEEIQWIKLGGNLHEDRILPFMVLQCRKEIDHRSYCEKRRELAIEQAQALRESVGKVYSHLENVRKDFSVVLEAINLYLSELEHLTSQAKSRLRGGADKLGIFHKIASQKRGAGALVSNMASQLLPLDPAMSSSSSVPNSIDRTKRDGGETGGRNIPKQQNLDFAALSRKLTVIHAIHELPSQDTRITSQQAVVSPGPPGRRRSSVDVVDWEQRDALLAKQREALQSQKESRRSQRREQVEVAKKAQSDRETKEREAMRAEDKLSQLVEEDIPFVDTQRMISGRLRNVTIYRRKAKGYAPACYMIVVWETTIITAQAASSRTKREQDSHHSARSKDSERSDGEIMITKRTSKQKSSLLEAVGEHGSRAARNGSQSSSREQGRMAKNYTDQTRSRERISLRDKSRKSTLKNPTASSPGKIRPSLSPRSPRSPRSPHNTQDVHVALEKPSSLSPPKKGSDGSQRSPRATPYSRHDLPLSPATGLDSGQSHGSATSTPRSHALTGRTRGSESHSIENNVDPSVSPAASSRSPSIRSPVSSRKSTTKTALDASSMREEKKLRVSVRQGQDSRLIPRQFEQKTPLDEGDEEREVTVLSTVLRGDILDKDLHRLRYQRTEASLLLWIEGLHIDVPSKIGLEGTSTKREQPLALRKASVSGSETDEILMWKQPASHRRFLNRFAIKGRPIAVFARFLTIANSNVKSLEAIKCLDNEHTTQTKPETSMKRGRYGQLSLCYSSEISLEDDGRRGGQKRHKTEGLLLTCLETSSRQFWRVEITKEKILSAIHCYPQTNRGDQTVSLQWDPDLPHASSTVMADVLRNGDEAGDGLTASELRYSALKASRLWLVYSKLASKEVIIQRYLRIGRHVVSLTLSTGSSSPYIRIFAELLTGAKPGQYKLGARRRRRAGARGSVFSDSSALSSLSVATSASAMPSTAGSSKRPNSSVHAPTTISSSLQHDELLILHSVFEREGFLLGQYSSLLDFISTLEIRVDKDMKPAVVWKRIQDWDALAFVKQNARHDSLMTTASSKSALSSQNSPAVTDLASNFGPRMWRTVIDAGSSGGTETGRVVSESSRSHLEENLVPMKETVRSVTEDTTSRRSTSRERKSSTNLNESTKSPSGHRKESLSPTKENSRATASRRRSSLVRSPSPSRSPNKSVTGGAMDLESTQTSPEGSARRQSSHSHSISPPKRSSRLDSTTSPTNQSPTNMNTTSRRESIKTPASSTKRSSLIENDVSPRKASLLDLSPRRTSLMNTSRSTRKGSITESPSKKESLTIADEANRKPSSKSLRRSSSKGTVSNSPKKEISITVGAESERISPERNTTSDSSTHSPPRRSSPSYRTKLRDEINIDSASPKSKRKGSGSPEMREREQQDAKKNLKLAPQKCGREDNEDIDPNSTEEEPDSGRRFIEKNHQHKSIEDEHGFKGAKKKQGIKHSSLLPQHSPDELPSSASRSHSMQTELPPRLRLSVQLGGSPQVIKIGSASNAIAGHNSDPSPSIAKGSQPTEQSMSFVPDEKDSWSVTSHEVSRKEKLIQSPKSTGVDDSLLIESALTKRKITNQEIGEKARSRDSGVVAVTRGKDRKKSSAMLPIDSSLPGRQGWIKSSLLGQLHEEQHTGVWNEALSSCSSASSSSRTTSSTEDSHGEDTESESSNSFRGKRKIAGSIVTRKSTNTPSTRPQPEVSLQAAPNTKQSRKTSVKAGARSGSELRSNRDNSVMRKITNQRNSVKGPAIKESAMAGAVALKEKRSSRITTTKIAEVDSQPTSDEMSTRTRKLVERLRAQAKLKALSYSIIESESKLGATNLDEKNVIPLIPLPLVPFQGRKASFTSPLVRTLPGSSVVPPLSLPAPKSTTARPASALVTKEKKHDRKAVIFRKVTSELLGYCLISFQIFQRQMPASASARSLVSSSSQAAPHWVIRICHYVLRSGQQHVKEIALSHGLGQRLSLTPVLISQMPAALSNSSSIVNSLLLEFGGRIQDKQRSILESIQKLQKNSAGAIFKNVIKFRTLLALQIHTLTKDEADQIDDIVSAVVEGVYTQRPTYSSRICPSILASELETQRKEQQATGLNPRQAKQRQGKVRPGKKSHRATIMSSISAKDLLLPSEHQELNEGDPRKGQTSRGNDSLASQRSVRSLTEVQRLLSRLLLQREDAVRSLFIFVDSSLPDALIRTLSERLNTIFPSLFMSSDILLTRRRESKVTSQSPSSFTSLRPELLAERFRQERIFVALITMKIEVRRAGRQILLDFVREFWNAYSQGSDVFDLSAKNENEMDVSSASGLSPLPSSASNPRESENAGRKQWPGKIIALTAPLIFIEDANQMKGREMMLNSVEMLRIMVLSQEQDNRYDGERVRLQNKDCQEARKTDRKDKTKAFRDSATISLEDYLVSEALVVEAIEAILGPDLKHAKAPSSTVSAFSWQTANDMLNNLASVVDKISKVTPENVSVNKLSTLRLYVQHPEWCADSAQHQHAIIRELAFWVQGLAQFSFSSALAVSSDSSKAAAKGENAEKPAVKAIESSPLSSRQIIVPANGTEVERVLRTDKLLAEEFLQFLQKEFCEENMLFFIAIGDFILLCQQVEGERRQIERQQKHKTKRDAVFASVGFELPPSNDGVHDNKEDPDMNSWLERERQVLIAAQRVCDTFISAGVKYEINISQTLRKDILEKMKILATSSATCASSKSFISSNFFSAAEEEVHKMLVDPLQRFIKSTSKATVITRDEMFAKEVALEPNLSFVPLEVDTPACVTSEGGQKDCRYCTAGVAEDEHKKIFVAENERRTLTMLHQENRPSSANLRTSKNTQMAIESQADLLLDKILERSLDHTTKAAQVTKVLQGTRLPVVAHQLAETLFFSLPDFRSSNAIPPSFALPPKGMPLLTSAGVAAVSVEPAQTSSNIEGRPSSSASASSASVSSVIAPFSMMGLTEGFTLTVGNSTRRFFLTYNAIDSLLGPSSTILASAASVDEKPRGTKDNAPTPIALLPAASRPRFYPSTPLELLNQLADFIAYTATGSGDHVTETGETGVQHIMPKLCNAGGPLIPLLTRQLPILYSRTLLPVQLSLPLKSELPASEHMNAQAKHENCSSYNALVHVSERTSPMEFAIIAWILGEKTKNADAFMADTQGLSNISSGKDMLLRESGNDASRAIADVQTRARRVENDTSNSSISKLQPQHQTGIGAADRLPSAPQSTSSISFKTDELSNRIILGSSDMLVIDGLCLHQLGWSRKKLSAAESDFIALLKTELLKRLQLVHTSLHKISSNQACEQNMAKEEVTTDGPSSKRDIAPVLMNDGQLTPCHLALRGVSKVAFIYDGAKKIGELYWLLRITCLANGNWLLEGYPQQRRRQIRQCTETPFCNAGNEATELVCNVAQCKVATCGTKRVTRLEIDKHRVSALLSVDSAHLLPPFCMRGLLAKRLLARITTRTEEQPYSPSGDYGDVERSCLWSFQLI